MKTSPNIFIYINGTYNLSLSGGVVNIIELIRRLKRNNYKVSLITNPLFVKILEKENIVIDNIYLTDDNKEELQSSFEIVKLYLKRSFSSRIMTKKIIKNIAENEKAIFIFGSEIYSGLSSLGLLTGYKKMLIYNMVAPNPLLGFNQKIHFPSLAELHYWLVSLVSFILIYLFDKKKEVAIFAVAENIKNQLSKAPFIKSRYIHTAFVGVDLSYSKLINIDEKKYDFVWIGRDHPQKGVDDLERILLLLKIKIPEFTCQIIGDVENRITKFASENNLENNLFIRGKAYGSEKFDLLANSKIFLFTSHFESFGIVVVENFHVYNEVVGYEIPSSVYNFKNNIHFVKNFNVVEFADKAAEILRMYPQSEQLEQNKKYTYKFDWDETFKVYERIINDHTN